MKKGDTALIVVAAMLGYKGTVRELLSSGATVDLLNLVSLLLKPYLQTFVQWVLAGIPMPYRYAIENLYCKQ